MKPIQDFTASSSGNRENAVRRCLFPALLVFCGAIVAPAATAQSPEVLSYRIEQETWGDIGAFSNTIRREDGKTEVESRLRIAVTRFWIVLYREEADRRETWEDGRLTAYQSTTNVDGDIIRISGQADGNDFVIQRPDGEAVAPLDVFPTNLWSIEMKNAETVMGTKSGVLVPVEVQDGGWRTIEIDDQDVDVQYFKITPLSDPGVVPFPQEGWFDAAGIPVRFAAIKDGEWVVFTMTNYRDVMDGRNAAQ